MADCYSRGEVRLREAGELLSLTTRETLELFWNMGITGNVGTQEASKAISLAETKLKTDSGYS